MKLEGHPQKEAILEALERRRLKGVESFADRFMNELFGSYGCKIMTAQPVMNTTNLLQ